MAFHQPSLMDRKTHQLVLSLSETAGVSGSESLDGIDNSVSAGLCCSPALRVAVDFFSVISEI